MKEALMGYSIPFPVKHAMKNLRIDDRGDGAPGRSNVAVNLIKSGHSYDITLRLGQISTHPPTVRHRGTPSTAQN